MDELFLDEVPRLALSDRAGGPGSSPRPCRPNPFVALACASCRRSLRTLFFFVLSVLALARDLSFCPVVRVQTKATDCVSEGQKTAAAAIVFVAVPIWDALMFWDSSPFMATFCSYSSEREWAQARESCLYVVKLAAPAQGAAVLRPPASEESKDTDELRELLRLKKVQQQDQSVQKFTNWFREMIDESELVVQ
ncbi:unnamed protein product [Sphagnum jensenii]|uniref:Uncharacterized protein n=1 Tax=Sphagnum jensenii TaxID=128206 RepID=A0ABP1AQJ4_9BRYO